jgi:gamma-glutamyltranspeptidase/glutathione hydrolase
VEAWYRLHERLGRLPMQDILAPAIAYARDGAPVGQIAAYDWPYLLDAFYRGSIAK